MPVNSIEIDLFAPVKVDSDTGKSQHLIRFNPGLMIVWNSLKFTSQLFI
jgi:hypothetical protein